MGVGCYFLYLQFSSITFTVCVWGGSKVPFVTFQIFSLELAMEGSHPSLYYDFHLHSHPSLAVKPSIICKFQIHSGSLQKMLTSLFNLVGNTQKSKWTILFDCEGKISSYWKGFRKDQGGPTLNALHYGFSPHFWDKGVTILLSYNMRNIIKQNWHWIHLKILKQS